MRISPDKLKAIILYFSQNTDKLGKVKLMKLIYFLDFVHLKKYGRPVTFDTYIHLDHGPIPSAIMNLVNDAVDDLPNSILSGTVDIQFIRTHSAHPMCKIVPARKFTEKDKDLFSESELEILAEVASKFKKSKSDEIENASHEEAAWKDTSPLQEISYSLAAKDPDSEITEEEINLLLKTL